MIEPLLLGEIRVSFQQASGHNISSTDQQITSFHVCFHLKMPYLVYSVESLMLSSQHSGLNEAEVPHISSPIRAQPNLPVLGDTSQHSAI